MKKIAILFFTIITALSFVNAQESFFPERNQDWPLLQNSQNHFKQIELDNAIQFARENEYSGARDLRKGHFKRF